MILSFSYNYCLSFQPLKCVLQAWCLTTRNAFWQDISTGSLTNCPLLKFFSLTCWRTTLFSSCPKYLSQLSGFNKWPHQLVLYPYSDSNSLLILLFNPPAHFPYRTLCTLSCTPAGRCSLTRLLAQQAPLFHYHAHKLTLRTADEEGKTEDTHSCTSVLSGARLSLGNSPACRHISSTLRRVVGRPSTRWLGIRNNRLLNLKRIFLS